MLFIISCILRCNSYFSDSVIKRHSQKIRLKGVCFSFWPYHTKFSILSERKYCNGQKSMEVEAERSLMAFSSTQRKRE